ncbi:MAG TPA: hypothetical protein VF727_17415 [Allosphingosinicella sp.]|jgi:hypothetical protein
MNDADLDALLSAALAPPDRPVDRGFVNLVEAAVVEEQRYRRSRRRLLIELATDAAVAGALAAAVAVLALAPAVADALGKAPGLVWAALLVLLVLWTQLMRGPLRILR